MEQNELFNEEEGKSPGGSGEDEFEGLDESPAPKKSNTKLLLGIVVLLIVGAYAANILLSEKQEEAPQPVKRIPIKGAPVMANVSGVKVVPVAPAQEVAKAADKKEKAKPEARKEEVKAAAKKEVSKAEVKKPSDVKVAKKEEAPKPKHEVKVEVKEKLVKKETVKAEAKKPADVKIAKKEAAKPRDEAKIAPKKAMVSTEVKSEGSTVIIATYAARYEIEAAQEKLKGSGIGYSTKEVKKKLAMNRVLVRDTNDKVEAEKVASELKAKGYDPFTILRYGSYKVYAVSNFNEGISRENKADLEKLGYSPAIEITETLAKAYELVAHAKSGKEAKELAARLEKMGFKPETGN